MARTPGRRSDGRRLALLRVEQATETDIGSATPLLGGGGFRYAPLPARMTSKRERLRFVYFDGAETVELGFEAAKALTRCAPDENG